MNQYLIAPRNPNPHSSVNPRYPRPAFAMLLVIVALAVVTVSTAAFLAGRLNAPDASANVGRAVKARVAAETGLDLATAILESSTVDWRTAHVNGVLLENYRFGQGTITINVASLDGQPPTAETNNIILTAEGAAEGLIQIVEAEIYAPPSTPEIQLDLAEFVLFGNESIRIRDAVIRSWNYSPDAALLKPLRLGTNAKIADAIRLESNARISHAYYYALNGASDSLLRDNSGMLNPPSRRNSTETRAVPLPAGPNPDTSNYTLYPIYGPSISSGQFLITETTAIGGDLTLRDLADVIMATPDTSLLVNGDLNLLDGGDILISAPVNIVVLGDLTITNFSSIELLNGGSVNLFVNGDILLEGGVLGLKDTLVFEPTRNPPDGINYYQDPSRFKVYQLPTSESQEWEILQKSYACAVFYGPKVIVSVRDSSAVFGSIVASGMNIDRKSAIFYDPALDSGWGYTNPESFIYNADGTYDTNVTTAVTNLDDSTIDDIEFYVTETSSKFDSKKEWKKIRKRMKRYGMRMRESKSGSSVK